MKTRCKFVCTSITKHGYQGMVTESKMETVKFNATYGGITEEDQSFAEATPNGTLEISVTNPNVIGKFKLGKTYYLDIMEVE